MNKITKHYRKKFLAELNTKWLKKFRNYQLWLDDDERDFFKRLERLGGYPEK